MTNDEIKTLLMKARQHAIRYGYQEDADDFAQEAFIAIARGREPNLYHLFGDYLRKNFGDTRVRGNSAHKLRRHNRLSIDSFGEEDGGQNDRLQFELSQRANPGGSGLLPESLRPDWRSRVFFENGRNRRRRRTDGRCSISGELVFELIEDGLSQLEISEICGVTEGRISQLMRDIREKTNQALTLAEVWDTYIDDSEYSKLQIDWIAI